MSKLHFECEELEVNDLEPRPRALDDEQAAKVLGGFNFASFVRSLYQPRRLPNKTRFGPTTPTKPSRPTKPSKPGLPGLPGFGAVFKGMKVGRR